MGRKREDLTGQRFGRLTVISYNEEITKQKGTNSHWNCKCDCGNEKIVCGSDLKRGHTISCGCYSSDRLKKMWENEDFRQTKSKQMKKLSDEQWMNEDFRKKKSNKMKEMWESKEYKKMQSDKTKKQWEDEDFKKMHQEKMRETAKKLWQDEAMKWRMSYKGGITSIKQYLRKINEQWYDDCKQQANYTCELTGKVGRKLHTHHLKAFSTIIFEAHELNNIEIKPHVKDYTQEELHKLEEYVASWHKDNSNAVVLCEEVHMLFHNLYGKGGNTPEQFEEFKQRYLNGEFDEIIK